VSALHLRHDGRWASFASDLTALSPRLLLAGPHGSGLYQVGAPAGGGVGGGGVKEKPLILYPIFISWGGLAADQMLRAGGGVPALHLRRDGRWASFASLSPRLLLAGPHGGGLYQVGAPARGGEPGV
jgi:hypothetical protein